MAAATATYGRLHVVDTDGFMFMFTCQANKSTKKITMALMQNNLHLIYTHVHPLQNNQYTTRFDLKF